MTKQDDILNILIQKNLISQNQLVEIAQEAKGKNQNVLDVILEKQLVDEEEYTKAKAEVFNLPYENLIEKRIEEEVLSTISSEVAENYKIVCFEKDDEKIKIGIIDPDNFKAMEAVDFLAKEGNLEAEYYLISKQSFLMATKQYKSMDKELSSALKTRKEEQEEVITTKEKERGEINEVTKSAPVIKIVSVIIRHAVEGRASDIHIEPLRKETRVRYRIDGVLHTTLVLPLSIHDALVARIKVMANLKLDETRIPQDGRIRLMINDRNIDFRVSILPLIGAEKVVMRILETSKKPPTLAELGFEGEQLRVIEKNIKRTEGIMLITGPTGSGKSTTIFSIMNIVNREGVNIATLEDPVEYQLQGINQSQIKPDIGYTFASGLRSFLRQDPDIIMVGEIRDKETAELSIHAALTGHLVFSTLHTTDAPGAITRLVDMGVEAFLLGSTLHTLVAQRLTRKICDHCRIETTLPKEYLKDVKEQIALIGEDYMKKIIKDYDPNKLVFYKGGGCARCGNTGYTGRVAINEVLDINDKIKELILDGKRHLTRKDIDESQKFISVKQDGIIKVLKGVTAMEEVLRVMRV